MRSTLLLDDGQIIALGGMTQDIISLQQNGIPLLSSIPYLGWLFSWQSRSHAKTNLILFLRPVIIRNAEGYKALTNQRYQYVMDQQNLIQAEGNVLLPEIKPVTLENQVPYDDLVPNQKGEQVVTPLVDVRPSAMVNKKTTTVMPGFTDSVNNKPNVSALSGDNPPVTVTNVTR
jgi:general secretion pathway protein D